ncbi:MAG TPA: YtxH domain-containing protein [Candidatus Bathyarchaeia archaeon]|nr:YtxH domain-containing protein [Candidatus Bathyarchaeia archaeon]
MNEKERGNGFFSSFILGALVGAVLVFLFGTDEGKKIKDQLAQKGKELVDDLPEMISDLEKQGQEFVENTGDVRRKLEAKARELSPKVKKEVEKSLSNIEEAQGKGHTITAAFRKHFFTRRGKRLG